MYFKLVYVSKKTSDFTVSSSKSGYKYDIGNTEKLQ